MGLCHRSGLVFVLPSPCSQMHPGQASTVCKSNCKSNKQNLHGCFSPELTLLMSDWQSSKYLISHWINSKLVLAVRKGYWHEGRICRRMPFQVFMAFSQGIPIRAGRLNETAKRIGVLVHFRLQFDLLKYCHQNQMATGLLICIQNTKAGKIETQTPTCARIG